MTRDASEDTQRLAKILAEDLGPGAGVDRKKLAEECGGISQQAISNWIRTGRISKTNLAIVAKHTGKPLSRYWPDTAQPYELRPIGAHGTRERPGETSARNTARQRILDALEDFDDDELQMLADDIERDATRQRRLRQRRHIAQT